MQTTTLTPLTWKRFEPPDHDTWRDLAACSQLEKQVNFFPDAYDLASITAAKRVCAVCPVEEMCLEWALETNEPDGIWGGYTTGERRRLRRGQQVAA